MNGAVQRLPCLSCGKVDGMPRLKREQDPGGQVFYRRTCAHCGYTVRKPLVAPAAGRKG